MQSFGFPGTIGPSHAQAQPVRYGFPSFPLTQNATPALYGGKRQPPMLPSTPELWGPPRELLPNAVQLAGESTYVKYARFGVRGYGAIVGAAVGNALSDGIAAVPSGKQAALGVTLGALLPVAPLALAMAYKKPLKGTTQKALLASSIGLLALAFLRRRE